MRGRRRGGPRVIPAAGEQRGRLPRGASERSRSGTGERPRRATSERSSRASRRRSQPAAPAPVGIASLDGGIAGSAALLAALGLVMIYSTTAPLAIGEPVPPHLLRHLLAVAVGGVCVAVALRVPMAVWQRLAVPLWAISVVWCTVTWSMPPVWMSKGAPR